MPLISLYMSEKEDTSLLEMSLEKTVSVMVTVINKNLKTPTENWWTQVNIMNKYLIKTLSPRIVELLYHYMKRNPCKFPDYHNRWLHLFTHPNMSVLEIIQNPFNQHITDRYWIRVLPSLTKLVNLQLQHMCNDEILKTIGTNCLLLEKLDIAYNLHGPHNKNVLCASDTGIRYLTNLKQLRILTMCLNGHTITTSGFASLLQNTPLLEELRFSFPTFCLASILLASGKNIGPMKLKNMEYFSNTPEDMRKIFKMCPCIQELTLAPSSYCNRDAFLEQIATSNVRLNILSLQEFSLSTSFQHVLEVQGPYLQKLQLDFCIFDPSMSLVDIGLSCPNLLDLLIINNYPSELLPYPVQRPTKKLEGVFPKLKSFSFSGDNYNLTEVASVVLKYAKNIQCLTVNDRIRTDLSSPLTKAIAKGNLENLQKLDLGYVFMTASTIKKLIRNCDNLRDIVGCVADRTEIEEFISTNNLNWLSYRTGRL